MKPLAIINACLAGDQRARIGALVQGGLMTGLGPDVKAGSLPEACDIIDAKGLVLSAGLIDLSAHCGEPGGEHRETLRTASEAAAAGGVTTIVARPDTDPVTDDPAIIDFLKRRARDKAIVTILPAAAITKGMAGREMTEFGLLREAGAVAFSDGKQSIHNAQVMRRAMIYARDLGALIMHHVEDADLAGSGVMADGEFATRRGLPGFPRDAETIILERDLRLVAMTRARYHAAMISTVESVALIARAKEQGLPVTCGVSINSLTLNENDIGDYRTFCKLSPPLRREDERLALVQALSDGVIDVVVSDHDPQDVETKRVPFAEAANGAIGLETMLSAGMRLVHAGLIDLPRLLEALSAAPANLIGIPAGRLAVGAPADLILIDPDEPWVCDKQKLKSRAKNSPFDEARMTGRVTLTMVGGAVVHRSGGV
ncbi:MAG: dihydroorotase [Bosea sp. (in: a-proteobacteria)]